MNRILPRLLPCLAILFAAGCSTYEKRFVEASRVPVKNGQPAGAYAGKWMSASHPGGGGNLRCILSQMNGTDYRADFHATWHGFSSEHVVVLHTKPISHKKPGKQFCEDDERRFVKGALDFEGTSALHTIIGAGTYACKGWLKPIGNTVSMCACYDATYDKGTFQLTRVVPKSGGR